MKRIDKQTEKNLAIYIARHWALHCLKSITNGDSPAKLTDVCTDLHIDGMAEEWGVGKELTISKTAYSRIKAKAKEHAIFKLNQERFAPVLAYFQQLN